jgi:hypothetical protein
MDRDPEYLKRLGEERRAQLEAEQTSDRMKRQALAFGPIAWQAYESTGRKISLAQAAEALNEGIQEVGWEQITLVGYLMLTKRVCEIAGKFLTDPT